MGLKTPLYDSHVRCGAKIIDFGGWDLPLHYGSQIEEHHAVRGDAGMFDVSHMCIIDLAGQRVRDFLRRLLANDVAKLAIPGKALYSCMLLPSGGVIDDLIVYFVADGEYRLVVNAGTRDKDLDWIRRHATDFAVTVLERRDLAMIAVQGPNARLKTAGLLTEPQRAKSLALPGFCGIALDSWFLARTGYTGEDGFEVMMPTEDAAKTWKALMAVGIRPVGLGARDTLRLEAGMSLYGNDLDESHHPLESGLSWSVAFVPGDRDFIGRPSLEAARSAAGHELVGLLLEGRGVLRSHQKVAVAGSALGSDGEVTSGTFSPTLNRSIALARIPHTESSTVQVDIRGKWHAASIVKTPFVRHGRALIPV
ncbi:MAG: glycine cleavage system aminomethyltransferase GcvT [Pseudomonadota bacterium]|nr:glycine cleavage system aminomethyltransferase GcvT [Pseudomonadota bacterium]